ncbi:hypothetical protein FKR81_37515 [Lentzea tibetensis]|uniref:Uncharacterized protein n=1 Tax=Lentzea tibetensis TaxID=2591470 RepID=A0A563EHP0_9PSEU|nr:hypothetical protein [Lentzea tibetensis]TWP46069.1 hypothetical protein FKR81_37515 [Lentzea tibetensis]
MDGIGTPHHRRIAAELCVGFAPHDKAALARMSGDDLTAQCEARAALFRYVYALLEQAKADGLESANNPRLSAVAGMWDLINELLVNAENAKLLANENAGSGDSESAG